MNRDDILQAARRFLAIPELEATPEERERALRKSLDELAFASHFADAPTDERDYPSRREAGVEKWRKLCQRYSTLFPDFGWYNVPEDMLDPLATAGIMKGDAIDDLADITTDLQEFVDRWEHNSPEDALEHFRLMFRAHWGRHLRQLQLYLHERAFYRFDP